MRRALRRITLLALVGGLPLATAVAPANAATAPTPLSHDVVAAYRTPYSDLATLVFADGSVRPSFNGDAFRLRMNTPVTGGAPVPTGGGHWVVGADGGVFSFGAGARFYGSMGGRALNQPVFSMSATRAGRGYWLVARDGGIFSFGDAKFLGSAGNLALQQPINGMTTTPTGRGYWLVARDGGVFGFGDAKYYGSLPGLGVHVRDVIGMAITSSKRGYWIARSNGEVYAFGDARALGRAEPRACDPIGAIVASSSAQGYRLVTASGSSFAFGHAPSFDQPTAMTRQCGGVTGRLEVPETAVRSGERLNGYFIVDNQTSAPLRLFTDGQCGAKWVVWLTNGPLSSGPIVPANCMLRPLVFPVGASQWPFELFTQYVSCGRAKCPEQLPPGQYYARFAAFGNGFPRVAPVPITVFDRMLPQ